MYTRAFSSEEDKQRYVVEHSLGVSPNSALMLILPQKYREHTEFSLSCFVYAVIVFTAITLIILRIRRVLRRNSSRMAVASLRMHRMLLKSLIWQTVIPFFFIFIPMLLLILSVTSKNIFIEGAETPYYARLFPAIALCILSLYSIAHVTVMITFTKPYQSFIFEVARRYCFTRILTQKTNQTVFDHSQNGTTVTHQRSVVCDRL
ncbi:hypothetical protein ANCCAN_20223 [Ancylostoma caninum]|uniref:G-protein coupled receptors family 1 profile domain-containing protein n=1 Tax=Ancylostoma caninum TaxID=29170 RepID=A0A368FNY6_ANCCA|nr:hypothetical protein ANCCAN_20223 [Ancylostoma caninum]